MSDTFFTQKNCDRCSASLSKGRILSFFNEETICTEICSPKESKIKQELRESGRDPLKYEGCGYIPTPQNSKDFITKD